MFFKALFCKRWKETGLAAVPLSLPFHLAGILAAETASDAGQYLEINIVKKISDHLFIDLGSQI